MNRESNHLPDILRRIVERRRESFSSLAEPDLPVRHRRLDGDHPFLAALESQKGRALIAEVKMGSPRLGSIEKRVDPEGQARTYAQAGAAALSVVVEPHFFFGSYGLLERCGQASGLPSLAKDFVVHPAQLVQARDAGARAILLIAALYSAEDLFWWASRARGLGLVPLVELHGDGDLEKLQGSEWELVGVNNRDLRTFTVTLSHSEALAPRLPAGALRVAESGITSGGDVARLREAGYHAFLVGESLLLAEDPLAKARELRG